MNKLVASATAAMVAMTVALPAVAAETGMMKPNAMMKQEVKSSRSSSKASSKSSAAAVNTACMQAAVEKRESAMIAAVDTYAATVKTALQVRKDALKAAWALTNKTQRESAIRAAWTAFQGTWKKASAALKTSKNSVWQTFRTDAKNCKQPEADSANAAADQQL